MKKRTVKRVKNERKDLKDKINKMLLRLLILEHGPRCQICGSNRSRLGLFHILPKGRFKRIEYNRDNLLVAGWFCCHFIFHHDPYIANDRIIPRIKELKGDDYRERLATLDVTSQKITLLYLHALEKALRKELKQVDTGWK